MPTLIAFPILSVLLILQSAILSRIPLLRGSADLVLLAVAAWALQRRVQTGWQWGIIGGLLVAVASGLPIVVPLVGYPLVVALAMALRRRVWQAPILAMFVATFFGTLAFHALSLAVLRLFGNPLPWQRAFNLVTLPSVLLNLVLAIPIYALLADLASWFYPEELEV